MESVSLADPWPETDAGLVALQERLAIEAESVDPWTAPTHGRLLVGGCFVAFARGEAGPGHPGDRAWASATAWSCPPADEAAERVGDEHLRGMTVGGRPRQADDVTDQHVAAGTVPAAYAPGLLARREGPILAAAVAGLEHPPEVLLVDATGLDHPRSAGLALHLGAALDLSTVGVTHRGLEVRDAPPTMARRGAWSPVELRGRVVGAWLCTKTGARPLLIHAAWRTDVEVAIDVVLRSSTEGARTPVPLQEARRVAREARHLDVR